MEYDIFGNFQAELNDMTDN